MLAEYQFLLNSVYVPKGGFPDLGYGEHVSCIGEGRVLCVGLRSHAQEGSLYDVLTRTYSTRSEQYLARCGPTGVSLLVVLLVLVLLVLVLVLVLLGMALLLVGALGGRGRGH